MAKRSAGTQLDELTRPGKRPKAVVGELDLLPFDRQRLPPPHRGAEQRGG